MKHQPSLADGGAFALPATLWAEIVAHLDACLPLEGVGYLAGPPGGSPTIWLALDNELQSPTRFRASAKSGLDAHKVLRATRTDILAVVHSHPTSPPVPSATDQCENPFGDLIPWLIVGYPLTARLWQLGPTVTELPWRLT